ncbi:hypothetical protein GXW82_31310 [Streptacidiphilus sp. 4-A2]|nr:hypothetical protein [Streptacidiphilus sp. 4-A2]
MSSMPPTGPPEGWARMNNPPTAQPSEKSIREPKGTKSTEASWGPPRSVKPRAIHTTQAASARAQAAYAGTIRRTARVGAGSAALMATFPLKELCFP